MQSYDLDFDNAEYLIVSNDTFCFLKYGEEPLDEENLKEIYTIYSDFGDNFIISDEYEYLEDGTVSIELIPYKAGNFDYDMYLDLFNNWQLQLKLLDGNKAKIRYYNPYKEAMEEEVEIVINKSGKQEFTTKLGSIYPLKSFIKV